MERLERSSEGLTSWRLGGRFLILKVLYFFMWRIDNLEVYRKICFLIPRIYVFIGKLPVEERFELGSQMRRAVVSIKLNFKEGSGKRTSADFVSYLDNAMGNLKEVVGQVETGVDLGFIDEVEGKKEIGEMRRLERSLAGYIEYVRGKGVM